MIELRALHHFAVACRSASLTVAAQSLGIALSTLSQSLKLLEADVGQPLFVRQGSLSPTPAARALLRTADALLLAERSTSRWLAAPERPELRPVVLQIALGFTIGAVGQAILRAADRVGRRHPDIFVDTVWSDEREGGAVAGLTDGTAGRIAITLRPDPPRRGIRSTLLLSDPWMFARRFPLGTRDLPSLDDLARAPVVVPLLARPLLDQAHRYLSRIGLRGVRFLQTHPGDLPQILRDHSGATLFAPRSLLSQRLGVPLLTTWQPAKPLAARIVAHELVPSEATGLVLRALKRACAMSENTPPERPRLTRREISYFLATERVRRISTAAKTLGISQPALSEQIHKLERAAGATLFERRGDGILPTAQGQRLSAAARLIETGFARLADGRTTAVQAARRSIALGILPSVHQHGFLLNRVADALVDVQTRRPGLALTVQEAPNTVLQDWVTRGTTGIAIVETTLPHMPRLPLGSSEALAAIVDVRHGLLPAGPVRLADLVAQKLVTPTTRFGLRQLLDEAAYAHQLVVRPTLEIDTLPLIVALLARLPVCAILPPSAVEREVASGELTVHPIVEPTIRRKLFVIYSGERTLSEAERDLVNTLRRKLAERRPRDAV